MSTWRESEPKVLAREVCCVWQGDQCAQRNESMMSSKRIAQAPCTFYDVKTSRRQTALYSSTKQFDVPESRQSEAAFSLAYRNAGPQ